MVLSRFPTYLRVVGSPVFDRHAAGGPAAPSPARTLLAAEQLYGRLEAMGRLAPGASLSFVAVHLDGSDHLRGAGNPGAWRQALADTGLRVIQLTRATDAAGWLRPDTLGVALQGAGPYCRGGGRSADGAPPQCAGRTPQAAHRGGYGCERHRRQLGHAGRRCHGGRRGRLLLKAGLLGRPVAFSYRVGQSRIEDSQLWQFRTIGCGTRVT